jgi:hypothetical protein
MHEKKFCHSKYNIYIYIYFVYIYIYIYIYIYTKSKTSIGLGVLTVTCFEFDSPGAESAATIQLIVFYKLLYNLVSNNNCVLGKYYLQLRGCNGSRLSLDQQSCCSKCKIRASQVQRRRMSRILVHIDFLLWWHSCRH